MCSNQELTDMQTYSIHVHAHMHRVPRVHNYIIIVSPGHRGMIL